MNSQNVIVNLFDHNNLLNLNIDSNNSSDNSKLDSDQDEIINLNIDSNNSKLDSYQEKENNNYIDCFINKENNDIENDVYQNDIIERIHYKNFDNINDIIYLQKSIKKMKTLMLFQFNVVDDNSTKLSKMIEDMSTIMIRINTDILYTKIKMNHLSIIKQNEEMSIVMNNIHNILTTYFTRH